MVAAQPSAPENCTIFRGSKGYAEVQCTSNYDGGIRQTYYLEVYDNAKTVMYGNYTNSKRPHFVLEGLSGLGQALFWSTWFGTHALTMSQDVLDIHGDRADFCQCR